MESAFSTVVGDHYIRSLEEHRRKSGNLVKNNEFLNKYLPNVIADMLQRRSQTGQFNILSVGCGTGKTDFEIIKLVENELQANEDCHEVKIFNRAVEPSEASLNLYRAALQDVHCVQSSRGKDNQPTFDLCQKTFQEYIESKNDAIKFDIIHFVHSIYYVDVEKALLRCFEQELNEAGVVVCFVVGEDLMYEACVKQGHVWHCGNQTSESWMTAEDIIEIADRHDWKHKLFNQEYPVDVTEVFDEESVDGNLLLDFLTHVMAFRKTTGQKQVEEMLKLIQQLSSEKNGKRIGKRIDQLLLIYK